MFLSYLALVLLLAIVVLMVYVLIYIHDIPYQLAKERGHPNAEAIHIASWISLFMLHALWPFLMIWATANKPVFLFQQVEADHQELERLREQVAVLEGQIAALPQGDAAPDTDDGGEG